MFDEDEELLLFDLCDECIACTDIKCIECRNDGWVCPYDTSNKDK